jgi:hypothetical protein
MTRWSNSAEYGGVRYRSHLEARWAIFLDHLAVKALYEPQGFTTDGEPYLPDFAIFGALGLMWAEIKPEWQSDPEGVAKWRRFSAQRPQPSRAVLFAGLPTLHVKSVIIGGDDGLDDPARGAWEDDTQQWRPCPSGHHFDLAYPGTFGARFADDGCPDDFGGDGEARIAAASQAALSYRFGKTETAA